VGDVLRAESAENKLLRYSHRPFDFKIADELCACAHAALIIGEIDTKEVKNG
jgi:hypothetical protein